MSSVSGNTHQDRKYSHTETEKTTLYSGGSIHAKNHRKISEDIPHHELKYKTEVCQFWEIGVRCPFGKKCVYAHGEVEMRAKSHISNKYKTKLCKNFTQHSYCPYGMRCQFIHNAEQDYKSVLGAQKVLDWFYDDPKTLKLLIHSLKKEEQFQPNKTDFDENVPFNNPKTSFKQQCQDVTGFAFQGYSKPRLYSL